MKCIFAYGIFASAILLFSCSSASSIGENAGNKTGRNGATKTLYEQNFNRDDYEGQAFAPVEWRKVGKVGQGDGNFTIKSEGNRLYYNMDTTSGGPKYYGKIVSGILTTGNVSFDLLLDKPAKENIGLSFYSSSVNGGPLAVRGALTPERGIVFYDGRAAKNIGTLPEKGWAHFSLDVDNAKKTYSLTVTKVGKGGELIASTGECSFYDTNARVGSISFCMPGPAVIGLDELRFEIPTTSFAFQAEIEPLEKTGKVFVTDDGDSFTLKNDYCMVVVDKESGWLKKYYSAEGYQIMGYTGDAAYLLNYTDSAFKAKAKQECTFNPKGKIEAKIIKESDDRCEVSVKAVRLLGGDNNETPIDMDLRFVLCADTPGLYMYAVVTDDFNAEDIKSGRKFSIGQSRYSIKFDYNEFPFSCVEKGIMKRMAGPGDFADVPTLMDSTWVCKDGEIFTKYNNGTYQYDHLVCGTYGNQGGLSLITPSRDWAGGGYNKQDIDVHGGTGNTFIVNWHLATGHMGTAPAEVTEGYSKVYGPVLWYAKTSGVSSKEEAWQDAVNQTKKEIAKWPYKWMDEEEPLIANDYCASKRATLKGKFSVTNGKINYKVTNDYTVENSIGWAVLSDARADYFAFDNKYYEFYAPVKADGTFEIKDIIPGTYKININVNGIMGEYERSGIKIGENANVDLGNIVWNDPIYGKTLWTIGIPDRTPEEFAYGKPYRYWGAHLLFNNLFPDGLDFTVGESDTAKDFFFLHPAYQTIGDKVHYDGSFYFDSKEQCVKYDASRASPVTGSDPRWRPGDLAEYRIHFDSRSKYKNGKATLLIAVCGNRSGTLRIKVNGAEVDKVKLIHDGAVARSAVNGIYQVVKTEFDASKILRGENVISLTHDVKEGKNTAQKAPLSGIIYDAIRLDIEE